MKKFVSMAMALVLVVGLAACGGKKEETSTEESTTPVESTESSTEETPEPTGEMGKVGLSVSTQNNPYFVTLAEGAKNKASELGIELIVVDAGDDTAKQVSDIEDLISKKVSVIIVNPVDSDAVTGAVEDAQAAGIQVVAVDRNVNGVEIACQIASDNVAGGRLAGEYMIELLGGEEGAKDVEVAEIEGIPGASSTGERGSGFHEAADGVLNVVAKQTANYNRAEGLSVAENILQAQPNIKGIFAHNDEMALGAVEAASAASKDLIIIGFDATDDAIAAVEAGTMAATVAQKPDLMGATSVEVAQRIMSGETVEKELPVEVELIKKAA